MFFHCKLFVLLIYSKLTTEQNTLFLYLLLQSNHNVASFIFSRSDIEQLVRTLRGLYNLHSQQCVCVCVCVCTFTCAPEMILTLVVYTHTLTGTHKHAPTHTHARAQTHTHSPTLTQTHTHPPTHTHTHQVLPLLRQLHDCGNESSHHVYMLLIILLILSQDDCFNKSIHEIVSV